MQYFNLSIVCGSLFFIFWNQFKGASAIIGGYEANINQFRFVVSIFHGDNQFCTGSILSDKFILTAAHCFIDSENNFIRGRFWILAGVSESKEKSRYRIEAVICKIYVPGNYKPPNLASRKEEEKANDIAITELQKNLLLKNRLLKKVKLPTIAIDYSELEKSVKTTVIGFGYNTIITENNKMKFVHNGIKMKYANTKTLDNNYCRFLYGDSILDSHLCAYVAKDNLSTIEGTCRGDSGAPLIIQNQNILIGILSFSDEDPNLLDTPAIYTKIDRFIPFIDKVLSKQTSSGDIRIGP